MEVFIELNKSDDIFKKNTNISKIYTEKLIEIVRRSNFDR